MSFLRNRTLLAVAFVSTLAASARAEIVARCGQGYLETVNGYRVLHLKGTPYEMGYQHGSLLKSHCKESMHYLFEVKAKDAKIEFFGLKLTAKQLVSRIFDIQRPFIPDRFIEELDGLADACGVERREVYVANLIPELFHCSGFALLNELTVDGTLLHGRVLDYGTDWKLQEHAVLMVAEPDGKIPFANVTYSGFIGSVTGMNRAAVSIGEMGGKGLGKWAGTPMAFLVRRVLEEAKTLDDAVAIFRDSKRTCQYYFVIADAKSNRAVGMEASADRFFTVKPGEKHDFLPTPVPGAVLLSAGDRYANLCRLVRDVRNAKEKFSVKKAIRLMDAPVAMDTNLHNALMAPGLGKLWIANAAPDGSPAWKQQYYELDFGKLLAQPRPTSGGKSLPPPPARAAKPVAAAAASAR